ncbi:MAG: hypothetical protein IPM98_12610 [Lewinellaceae bacterium]|nr:hypothetical protein [Lewinellaceae bacterium]
MSGIRPEFQKTTSSTPMRFNNPLRLSLIAAIFLSTTAWAQPTLWTDIREDSIAAAPGDRLIVPNLYRTLRLDFGQMRARLLTAPAEADYLHGTPGLLVYFPLPDGTMAEFEVWEAPVLHPDLGAQYPEIRAFAGKSRVPAGMTARFDVSPKGLHALLFNPGKSSIFIDPYSRGNTADYICYFKKNFVKRTGDVFECHVANLPIKIELPPGNASDRAGDCGNRREYRLALACTGEYANFHGSFGSNKAPALAAMNTSMTRVNGVFERDCGLRMVIIPNNTAIIFTDPATDPYTNNSGGTMLGENQTTCDNVIGTSNYDIGHVFSTGGGGVAYLGCVCNGSIKAGGVTGGGNPIGDPFDIDYVAYEMGHQYGANHTQYNGCNRNNSTAMEPGSASTIMGYAGICSPNVQSNSDDYFHAVSLQEIGSFVLSSGNGCSVKIATGNSAPVVPTPINRSIPRSTPFILTGTATDPNGDALTYCWEQMNAGGNQPQPPQPGNNNGPMFRSLLPVPENSRYMPNFPAVLANTPPTWEVLPSGSRTLNFRFTVRDNNPGGGCTTDRNMTVSTSSAVGPFVVTVPNGGESYPAGSTQTITWNVAGSNGSPVNCANVEILISTDGGNTFSTLLAGTPNDGTQAVTLSVSPTTQARIMVRAVGNIFYDISNTNFTISAPLPVEMTAFSARLETNAVRLDWSTATEKNNRGFHIERSADDAARFARIGWVDGRGTTTLPQAYTFLDTDLPPAEILYYRLLQTDFDGQEHRSDIRAVLPGNRIVDRQVAVWPNPAHDKIRLQLPNSAAGQEPTRATILNPAGIPVFQWATLPESGEMDVHQLAPGFMWF